MRRQLTGGFPCAPGKYRERIDFAPFGAEIGTAKLLMLLET